MVTIVIGAQWGDEGKGKIVDLLSSRANYVVRFHGGNNAGHTVINKYGKFPLHLVPAGIFNPNAQALITGGVILDLSVLIQEIKMLKKAGIKLSGRLLISPRAHIIMPYHKILDALYEQAKGKGATGTTGRGIGPTYADKVSYNGVRLFDLQSPRLFKEKLKIALSIKNRIIKTFGDKHVLNLQQVYKEKLKEYGQIRPYVAETFGVLQTAIKSKKNILLEGAHGIFLDNDWGTYPFVTASSVVSGSVTAGAGIPPKAVGRITGVVKAYTTRVGAGPFPTELKNKQGDELRLAGNEFGTTTGRPRRCGWFDAELIRFAAKVNGFTDLAITKLDVLSYLKNIPVCVGYTLNGRKIGYEELSANSFNTVKPVYKTFKGWQQPLGNIRKFKDLPKPAQVYLKAIAALVGTPIFLISVGPSRNQTIVLKS